MQLVPLLLLLSLAGWHDELNHNNTLHHKTTGVLAQQCSPRSPCQVSLGTALTGSAWSLGTNPLVEPNIPDETACCDACRRRIGCVLFDYSNRTSACRLHPFSAPLDLSSPLKARSTQHGHLHLYLYAVVVLFAAP